MKKLMGLFAILFFALPASAINETDQDTLKGYELVRPASAEKQLTVEQAFALGYALGTKGEIPNQEMIDLIKGNGVTREGFNEELENMDDIMDPILRYVDDWGDRCDDKRFCNQSNDILQEL